MDNTIDTILFNSEEMVLRFQDGRNVAAPLALYPRLLRASPKERSHWQILGKNRGIHWPDIDEDLSIDGLLNGVPSFETNSIH